MSSVTENVALSENQRMRMRHNNHAVQVTQLMVNRKEVKDARQRCSQKYAIVFPAQMVPDSKGDESVNKLSLFYATS